MTGLEEFRQENHALRRETEALKERISGLSAAVLRISASLDVATVLQEVVDSARTLTGARYGVIVTVDDAGQPLDFVTSGFTPEEYEQLSGWPEGLRFFLHLRDVPGPLRLGDLHEYVRSLGFSPDLMVSSTLQGVPMRHRGEYVGHFFLAGKDGGGEFTSEDEEVLVLFASQAATAIVNARTYRDEQRARADLEALVDTSPVGVLVFDPRTSRPVSFNREAKRIVGALRMPGRSLEELMGVVTCRFADRRDVALQDCPIENVLTIGKSMRAEELVISVPDGRSVRTLVNITPIRDEDGEVDSVVVTMQDLAPLEELERLRAELLGLVSHELRAPLMSIKGASSTLLGAATELDPAEIREFHRIIDTQADHMRGLIADLLDAGRIEAGTLTVDPEPSEVPALVDRARSTFLSGGGRHPILVDLPSDLPRAMADRRRVVQVLNNLLSNAARHAPQSSPIRVAAVRDGAYVAISVTDEGRGIPPDRLPQLFDKQAGLATGRRDGGTGNSGLGLAICKGLVEAHGGRVRAESAGVGQGARFTFTLPSASPAVGEADSAPRGASPALRNERDPMPILVVDDDPETLRLARAALASEGYAPVVTGDPEEVPDLVRTKRPQLVLLDLMLPDTDGIELMVNLPELADLPVIFVSGYGRDETIARALESGAADYIVKPFSPTELTARVRAALRTRSEPEALVLGDLAIDYAARRVSVAGRQVSLTAKEYELLRLLSLNAGRITTSESLLRQLWGGRDYAGLHLVRAFVRALRRKLGDSASAPTYIFTERGVGYRMRSPADPREPGHPGRQ